MQEYILHI